MKIALVANTDWFIHHFNRHLVAELLARGDEVVVVCPPGPDIERLKEMGARWRPWKLARREARPLAEWVSLRRLTALLAEEAPDLVHNFTLKCALYGALASRRAGVEAVVASITGLGYVYASRSLKARLLRPVVERLCASALPGTEVIFLNRDDRRQFIDAGHVTADSSHLIASSGVDVDRFSAPPPPDGPPVVVLIARMLRSKGVEVFVQAARQLVERGVVARFALVGDVDPGNPDGIARSTLDRWVEEGPVEWWGFREDMIAVYTQASVVCLPTFYREGVPTVLLEGAACGRALVASDMPGCREIVRPDVNGILVEPRSAGSLAAGLEPMLREPALAARLGRHGRKIVRNQFSVERVVSETLALYSRLAGGGSSGTPVEVSA